MKKTVIGLALFLLAAIIIVILNSFQDLVKETPADKPVVKIGFSTALSGNLSKVGVPHKQAAELALHDLNKRDTKYKYEIIFEDHDFDVRKTVLVNQKFLTLDKVDAIVDSTSKVGFITFPMANQHKIIHMNITAFDRKVADGNYNFLYRTLPVKEVEKMVSKIKKDGIKTVGIITAQDQGMEEFSAELKKVLTREDIKFDEVSIHHTTTDVTLIVQKLMRKEHDLYVLLTYSPSLDMLIKRFREARVKKPLTTIEMFAHLQDMSAVEGEWYVDAAALTSENQKRFKEYNNTEMMFGVGNSYDAIMLIAESFERAPTKEKAIEELRKIKSYDGVVGPVIQDPIGIFQSEPVIKKIVGGKPVIIKD